MVGLAEFGHAAVVADEEGSAPAPILRVAHALLGIGFNMGEISLLDTFIIMREDSRNVDAIRAGHTIVAFITGDGVQIVDVVGNAHQECVFLF